MSRKTAIVLRAIALSLPFLTQVSDAQNVVQWGFFEKTLASTNSYSNVEKYSGVTLSATFTGPGGVSRTVQGFWDGGTTWRIRFSPSATGDWSYIISSSDPMLRAASNNGSFSCIAPTASEVASNPNFRGFIRMNSGRRHFTYADGTPFLWIGDTLWDGNSQIMPYATDFKTYTANRKAKLFNVVQILVGEPDPLTGTENRSTGYNENGPLFFVEWNEINPANFQNLDLRIKHLIDNGIVPCIFMNWGSMYNVMGQGDIHAYYRYIVARYQAYNVIWCISGEYGYTSNLSAIRTAAQYVRQIDQLGHLITIHPGPNSYPNGYSSTQNFRGESWIDFHMHQTWRTGLDEHAWMNNDYALNDGPLVSSEAGYDGMWSHDRTRVRREAWTVLLSGAAGYTYGALGVAFAWNNGCCDTTFGLSVPRWQNVIDLDSSFDMRRISEFYSSIPWWTLVPRHDLVSNGYCMANPGKHYVVYLRTGGSTTVSGVPSGSTARWYNTRDGSWQAASGPTYAAPDGNDWVLLIESVDTTTPTISSVAAAASNSVVVVFNEAMDATTAGSIDNYALDMGVAVTQAAIGGDARSVVLTTSPLVEGTTYVVSVSNVRDAAGNVIAPNSTRSFLYSPPKNTPTVWWRFDEGGGSIAMDSIGEAHAQISGATWTDGIAGKAVRFDTASNCIDAGTIDPAASNMTIMAWIFWRGDPGRHEVIAAKRNSWLATDMKWQFGRNYPSGLALERKDSMARFNVSFPATNQWCHVAVTKSGNNVVLYLNGQTAASSTMSFGSGSGARLTIGNSHVGGTEGLNGTIDDLRIYERALTAAEVATIAALVPPVSTPDHDGNGLPDAWEIQHFGSAGLSQEESTADSDGDGMCVSTEFVCGTDPTNPLDFFQLNPLSVEGQFVGMSFLARLAEGIGYAGRNRFYAVELCEDLETQSWQIAPGFGPILGTNQIVTFEPGGIDAFYRIKTWLE